ncbi:MAG: hypothetical protein EAX96_07830 [Candidatus Lokiarchaeota archaeon]|nr:hypothetical protein [Candidatus Lokiarchaeota archaeon]
MGYVDTFSCLSESIRVPEIIKTGDLELKRIFLKCFFSDEGGLEINLKNKSFRIAGTQKNIEFLKEISSIINDFTIKNLINEKGKRITISKNSEKKKFFDKIGFLEGSKIVKGKFIGYDKMELLKHCLNNEWDYLIKIKKDKSN